MSARAFLRRHAAWLVVTLSLLSVFPYFARLNNPNENARVWMVKAVVDFHELSINRVCERWGYVNDKAVFEGKLYSSKAPGASFVGVPIYYVQSRLVRALGGGNGGEVSLRGMVLALRLFGVGIPLALFSLFFARFVARATGSDYARDLFTCALGLGTMLYPYGVLFVGHAWAAALAFSAFVVLAETPSARGPRKGVEGGAVDHARSSARRLAVAGALAGFAVMFEYQVIFAAVLLTGYAVARQRGRAAFFLLGALVPAALLGAYHTALFGRPWDFPLGHLENPAWAKLHNDARAFGLHPPDPRVALTIWVSPEVGLFAFSPVLAVGLTVTLRALVASVKKRLRTRDTGPSETAPGLRAPEACLILGIFLAMSAFLAGVPNWRSGWCVGPRYIVVVAPFLMAALVRAWPFARLSQPARLWQVMTAGLALAAILLNAVSGALYPHYPEAFDNPVFDLAWPLLKDGFVPYSLGWWLGLPGRWSLLPFAALLGTAAWLCLRGEPTWSRRQRLRHAGLSLAVVAVFLVALGLYGRKPRPEEDHATAVVKQLWEPTPASAPASPAPPLAPSPVGTPPGPR